MLCLSQILFSPFLSFMQPLEVLLLVFPVMILMSPCIFFVPLVWLLCSISSHFLLSHSSFFFYAPSLDFFVYYVVLFSILCLLFVSHKIESSISYVIHFCFALVTLLGASSFACWMLILSCSKFLSMVISSPLYVVLHTCFWQKHCIHFCVLRLLAYPSQYILSFCFGMALFFLVSLTCLLQLGYELILCQCLG